MFLSKKLLHLLKGGQDKNQHSQAAVKGNFHKQLVGIGYRYCKIVFLGLFSRYASGIKKDRQAAGG
jgi:hypothetical protein